jgi:hypothetical protein
MSAPSTSASHPPSGGAVELFEIPFASAMSDGDLSRLARALDLPARTRPPGAPREDAVGPARLDHSSGLFLTAGPAPGQWLLQARTWGHPGAESVHRWRVMATDAAREADPTVALLGRWHDDSPAVLDVHVGSVANKRLAAFRRRLVGVS